MHPPESNHSILIRPYGENDTDQIVRLILNIQQKEFNIPVTIQDQPDLLNINSVYQKGKGNFWCALLGENIVGTIGLIDIGNRQGVIRKMFVDIAFRGKDTGTALHLLNTLCTWSLDHEINELYLGTIDKTFAAHKFYRKNGFTELPKNLLPLSFPLMPVDNMFFRKILPLPFDH